MDMMADSIMAGGNKLERIILVTESGSDRGPPRRAVEAMGHRIARELEPEEAATWLGKHGPATLILFELDMGGDAAVKALEEVGQYSTYNGVPLLISAHMDNIDKAFRAASGPYVSMLCQPALIDRVSAMAVTMDNEPMLHDMSSDMDTQRLRRLADEVSRIARALSRLSSTDEPENLAASTVSDIQIGFRAEPSLFDPVAEAPDPAEIRKIIRLRRLREKFFDAALFADPAWDMLLDLMAAQLEEARVAVSSLCIAASVPPTTALRWIKAMSDHALFERCADPDDGRRIFIRLSDQAMLGMTRYFNSAKKLGGMTL